MTDGNAPAPPLSNWERGNSRSRSRRRGRTPQPPSKGKSGKQGGRGGKTRRPRSDSSRSRSRSRSRPRRAARQQHSTGHNVLPNTLLGALSEVTNLSSLYLTEFIKQLAGDGTDDMAMVDFDLLTAPLVAEVVRNLTIPDGESVLPKTVAPLTKAKIFSGCARIATTRGGAVAWSFGASGLHDERLAQPEPAQPVEARTRTRKAVRAKSPAKPPVRKRKFDGVLQQGGEGADDEFVVMSKETHRRILKEYERWAGAAIPKAERPSVTQLSAFHAKLHEDEN